MREGSRPRGRRSAGGGAAIPPEPRHILRPGRAARGDAWHGRLHGMDAREQGGQHVDPTSRRLGMDRPITRRDFLIGVRVGASALVLCELTGPEASRAEDAIGVGAVFFFKQKTAYEMPK